ncbi:MAG TPA: glycosyl hydrolase-related protein [Terriglobales bacterium]|nr:glycosyl hydrolase-related protein [Terriglobales bacterium]
MKIRTSAILVALFFFVGIQFALAQSSPQSRPSSIKTIYIFPSSHWDLGFIAPPEEVLPRLKPHIDEVIANCEADPEFRWTIESVWQIREWLSRTEDQKQIDRFVALVKKGQIQISAVFGSMHTEFMGTEQLNRIVYDMKEVERRLGVKTDFAMMNDVPGFTLRLPQVLARSGVRYFLNGSNLFIGGGTSLYPGKVPFYWKSPDGSQVLLWHTQSKFGGYTEALADYYLDPISAEPYTKEQFYPKELNGLPPLEIMRRGVDQLLAKFDNANYPYDAVAVMYLHDFISSNLERDHLLPSVRAWNAAGKTPRLVVATPAEFFREMENRHAQDFKTYSGDWTGLWSEVKTNSPRISADARWAQDHTSAAETIWSLLSFKPGVSYPWGNFEETRINLLKYAEHSGSGQVGWPKLMTRAEVDQQNREYVEYARSARLDIGHLLDSGMMSLFSQQPDSKVKESLVVFNPLSWMRNGTVQVKTEANVQVRDVAANVVVPSQRLSKDEIEFFAKDVPSLGYRHFVLEPAMQKVSATDAPGTALENQFYRVEIRPSDGSITRVLDKQSKKELLDPKNPRAAGELMRWTLFEAFPNGVGTVNITHRQGSVTDSLRVVRPGSYWPETVIELPANKKTIRITNTLDRSRMPFVASLQAGEYYSFSFPFQFNGSAQVWLDSGIGFHRIPDDYLDGARTDSAVPQHSLVLSGADKNGIHHVVISERESFFNYLIGMPGSKGATGAFMNEVRVAALRKQDQGDTKDLGMVNFETVEPGLDTPLKFSIALTSGEGPLDPVQAYRAGWEQSVPLLVSSPLPGTRPSEPVGSYISLDAPNVQVLAFKPSNDRDPNHFMLRLQEISGKESDVTVTSPLKPTVVEETTMTEDQVIRSFAANPIRLRIKPHQTLTLRLTIPHESKTRSHRWWEW